MSLFRKQIPGPLRGAWAVTAAGAPAPGSAFKWRGGGALQTLSRVFCAVLQVKKLADETGLRRVPLSKLVQLSIEAGCGKLVAFR